MWGLSAYLPAVGGVGSGADGDGGVFRVLARGCAPAGEVGLMLVVAGVLTRGCVPTREMGQMVVQTGVQAGC